MSSQNAPDNPWVVVIETSVGGCCQPGYVDGGSATSKSATGAEKSNRSSDTTADETAQHQKHMPVTKGKSSVNNKRSNIDASNCKPAGQRSNCPTHGKQWKGPPENSYILDPARACQNNDQLGQLSQVPRSTSPMTAESLSGSLPNTSPNKTVGLVEGRPRRSQKLLRSGQAATQTTAQDPFDAHKKQKARRGQHPQEHHRDQIPMEPRDGFENEGEEIIPDGEGDERKL